MSYFLKRTENNLWHGKFSNFPEDLVTHAVSTRIDGASKPPFDSLNLALHVGDEPENVIANRKKFVQSLGFDITDIVTPNQVHGEKIFRVDENYRGCGCTNYADSIPETDALITDTPALPLMLCFADCVPIFFVDVENSVQKNRGENFAQDGRRIRHASRKMSDWNCSVNRRVLLRSRRRSFGQMQNRVPEKCRRTFD